MLKKKNEQKNYKKQAKISILKDKKSIIGCNFKKTGGVKKTVR